MMYVILLELNARPADQYPELERAIKARGHWSNGVRGSWLLPKVTGKTVRVALVCPSGE